VNCTHTDYDPEGPLRATQRARPAMMTAAITPAMLART
jgi:hypothetical protein